MCDVCAASFTGRNDVQFVRSFVFSLMLDPPGKYEKNRRSCARC